MKAQILEISDLEKKLSKRVEFLAKDQGWTKGRSSTAVAEDLGPTATVAEV